MYVCLIQHVVSLYNKILFYLFPTDDKNNRGCQGLNMFLVRVLLGNIYRAKGRHQYKHPPCTKCLNDECTNQNHKHFDSVVADFGGGSLFREFIVYNASQCYPEYIITYNRK